MAIVQVEPGCRCREGRVEVMSAGYVPTGEVLLMPQVHSCRYVRVRTSLIQIAESEANQASSVRGPLWAQVFHHSMERLMGEAVAAGLL